MKLKFKIELITLILITLKAIQLAEIERGYKAIGAEFFIFIIYYVIKYILSSFFEIVKQVF